MDQLAEIFAVDRDTVSAWLTAWQTEGLMGLRDRSHSGRLSRGSKADVVVLEADLEQSPQRAQALPDRFHERTGKRISFTTVKRWLKESAIGFGSVADAVSRRTVIRPCLRKADGY